MIKLPVSIGEALDKLTILEIKCSRITDPERVVHCRKEYELLKEDLSSYIDRFPFQYRQLYAVNDDIWVMQDDIRMRPDPLKCVSILDKNDMRFRIKDNINALAKSYVREQKGYSPRRALFIGHLGLGDHIGLIGAVRYIAQQHDVTIVIAKEHNAENVASFFRDNDTIKIHSVKTGFLPGRLPHGNIPGECVEYNPIDFDHVYRSGVYVSAPHEMSELPHCFYRDMGMDPNIRHSHFHIPVTPEAKALYESIGGAPYIFVQHQSSSNYTDNLVTWDRNEILTIDPNINMYPEGHPFHTLASAFVNKPFIEYVEVIKHAKEIHVPDSSFYCLACYLPLDASVKKCYNRETGAVIETYNFT